MIEVAPNITINKAVKSDVAEIIKIASEGNLSYWSFEDYCNEVERSNSVLMVAKSVNENVGFISARLIINSYTFAEIYNIGVAETQRNKKIGKKLLLELFDKCMQAAIQEIWLEVRISNLTAITFYKKMGFEIVHTRKNFYANPSEDALVMRYKFTSEGL